MPSKKQEPPKRQTVSIPPEAIENFDELARLISKRVGTPISRSAAIVMAAGIALEQEKEKERR